MATTTTVTVELVRADEPFGVAERAAIAGFPELAGPLLEAFVVGELRKQATWCDEPVRIYHYRDRTGPEIDIIVEHADGRIVAIEVKATSSLGANAAKWLVHLRDGLGERFVQGIVLYTGANALPLGNRLTAQPIAAISDLFERLTIAIVDLDADTARRATALRAKHSSLRPRRARSRGGVGELGRRTHHHRRPMARRPQARTRPHDHRGLKRPNTNNDRHGSLSTYGPNWKPDRQPLRRQRAAV